MSGGKKKEREEGREEGEGRQGGRKGRNDEVKAGREGGW